MKKLVLHLSLMAVMALGCKDNTRVDAAVDNQVVHSKEQKEPVNLITNFKPKFPDNDINVVVEIPSGTIAKWEVEKTQGQLELEEINGKPRLVNYLGYPGNYGMIPRTLLPKEFGGDGDPLDVIVLGPPVARGEVIKCKILGVLKLLDRGEQDDKLIAVREGTPLYHVNNLDELNASYEGISEILSLWFANYKGPGKMEFQRFGGKEEAMKVLDASIAAYQN